MAEVVVERVEVGAHTADLGLDGALVPRVFRQLGGTTRYEPRVARSGGALRCVDTPAR